jgi:3-hydroxyacyl-CoA dehydrogenase
MESLQTIGIIGAGTMGSGSARVRAHAGLSVSMPDLDDQRVELNKAKQLGCNHPDVPEGWAPA